MAGILAVSALASRTILLWIELEFGIHDLDVKFRRPVACPSGDEMTKWERMIEVILHARQLWYDSLLLRSASSGRMTQWRRGQLVGEVHALKAIEGTDGQILSWQVQESSPVR